MNRPLIAAATILFTLTACAAPETGQVMKRDYNSAWTEMRHTCSYSDDKGTCRSYNSIPVYHPESCALYLKRGKDEGWRTIPCTEYPLYKIGDQYPKGQ